MSLRAVGASGLVALTAATLGGCADQVEVLGTVDAGPRLGGDAAFILGAEITWTQEDEASGATYVDDDGTPKDIVRLLADHGFNYVRLRTFVDPTRPAPAPDGGTFAPYSAQGFGDLAHTTTFAKEVKDAGLGLLLDFHYSDYWADPGKQIKPAAWAADDLAAMTNDLQTYTTHAVAQLVASGARPDLVQTGNDITPGLELTPGAPLGSSSSWSALGQLLKAAIAGVHAVDPTIPIMLHIDRCGDATTSIGWIESALAQGVSFDVFGESCFVAYQGAPSGWGPTFAAIAARFPTLRLAIAQYAGDPGDPTVVRKANDMIFGLPNHQGIGTFFWEPTHSGAWGAGLFSSSGTPTQYATVPASIDQFDAMRAAYAR
jgi:arabinogalactan endo-1,4-beta-galactosidase